MSSFFIENKTNKNIPRTSFADASSNDFSMTNTRKNKDLENDGQEGFRIVKNYTSPSDSAFRYVLLDTFSVDLFENRMLISADSKTLVYPKIVDTSNYLFSVPIAGPQSSKVQISITSQDPNVLKDYFKISQDSFNVCYTTLTTGIKVDLYSVPITGPFNEGVKLTNVSNYVIDFRISKDDLRCIYYGAVESSKIEIYSVPIDGGSFTKLNEFLDGDVINFLASENFIVFKADASNDGNYKLFKVDIAGGTNAPVFTGMGSVLGNANTIDYTDIGGDYTNDDKSYAISSDGKYVVYVTNGTSLYSFDTNTNTNVLIGNQISNFLLSSDASFIVYTSDVLTLGKPELYSVSIAGGTPVKLNTAVVNGVDEAEIASDSKKIVYVGDAVSLLFELFTVSPNGTNNINFHVIPNTFFISPNSKYVGFTNASNNLFSVPIDGSGSVKILSSFECSDIKMTDNKVFYRVDVGGSFHKLYCNTFTGNNEVDLSKDFTNIDLYVVSKDGKKVAFHAFKDGLFYLYSIIFKN